MIGPEVSIIARQGGPRARCREKRRARRGWPNGTGIPCPSGWGTTDSTRRGEKGHRELQRGGSPLESSVTAREEKIGGRHGAKNEGEVESGQERR